MTRSFQEFVFNHYNIISDPKLGMTTVEEEGIYYQCTKDGLVLIFDLLTFFDVLKRSILGVHQSNFLGEQSNMRTINDRPDPIYPNIFDATKDNDTVTVDIRKAYIRATQNCSRILEFCELLSQSPDYNIHITEALYKTPR
jgi:hypothetical protein